MQPLTLEHCPIERLVSYARNPRRNDHVVELRVFRDYGIRLPDFGHGRGDCNAWLTRTRA
jgi:hypothetical protein